jgi:hypothetical protein
LAEMSPLRRRMVEDMTVRNLSPTTQRSYLHAVTKFRPRVSATPARLGPSLRATALAGWDSHPQAIISSG